MQRNQWLIDIWDNSRSIISLRTISEVEVPYFRHFSFKLLFTCCVR